MLRKMIHTVIVTGMLNLALCAQAKEADKPTAIPPQVVTEAISKYIDLMVRKYKFNKEKLTKVMDQGTYDPDVIRWITHPFEKKPWNFYRNFFVRKDRIDNGVKYWRAHQKMFDDVQARYGVDPSVIIAIIGIESYFGKHTGTYNELNALITLSFYYPKREKFFTSELTQFLLLARHEKLNPVILKGSYAGALGIPQFMPSSYRHYGVDYSKNQSIDLFTNHKDAIASIANYLNEAGWTQGQPIAVPATIKENVPKQLLSKTGKPLYTLSRFSRYRIHPIDEMSGHLKAALIAMHNTDSIEYWLVFRNFHAIMRYNPRTTYALAVFELSRAIKEAYERQPAQTSTPAAPTGKTPGSGSAVSTATARRS